MLLLIACTPGTDSALDTGDTGEPIAQVEGYGFHNASYSGQVFRNLLISDLKGYVGGLTDSIDNGDVYPVAGDVEADLNFYFEFDSSTSGGLEHGQSWDTPPLQTTYDEVSSDKDLVGKIAGNDATGQHADWTSDFVGWEQDGVTTPESLVRTWFAEIDAAAAARTAGDIPLDPSGAPIEHVFLSADGLDRQQLLEKFLRGAIAFSQGADDYLDDATPDKGLLDDHTTIEEGKDYTALEHGWDEGFGYFGAAVTYGDWTDEDIKAGPLDVDGDGFIDLETEVNWGHSVNAAKRDLGSVSGTDYTAQAFDNFVAGRALLARTAGAELSDEDFATLQGHRDLAVDAWEKSISSTCVHYINDTLQDMGRIGGEDYDFAGHAKHWSELKGFALSLQFNPRSPLSEAEFAELHELIGQAPVLEDAGPEALEAYAADLVAARTLLGEAYGFDASDLGDENGENGW